MKNRHSLLSVGGSLFIFGLSMLLFPSIFEISEPHKYTENESFMTGIILIIVGVILLSIKLFKLFKLFNR